MRLESISLCGVGTYRDTVTLSLRDLDPGLIAITGRIGRGKTLLLESPYAAWYREWASKPKKLTEYVGRSDGFIEVLFSIEGQGLFRSYLALDGVHDKSEAVLERIGADGRRTPLNDGKVTTYDQAIATLLPPRELLLASVLSAQNRAGSFVNLDQKGRKELFAKLLGLDHYEQLSQRAKSAADHVWAMLDRVTAQIAVLARDASDELGDELDARAQDLQEQLFAAELKRDDLTPQVQQIERDLEACQEAATAHATAHAKLVAVLADIARTERDREDARIALQNLPAQEQREREALVSAKQRTVDTLTGQIKDAAGLQRELASIDQQEAAKLKDIDERIAGNKTITGMAAEITAAVQAIEDAQAEIRAKQTGRTERQAHRDRLQERRRGLHEQLATLNDAQAALRRAEEDAAIIEDVPFGANCLPCRFMTNAAAAKERIPDLATRVADRPRLETEILDLDAELNAIERLIRDLGNEIVALESLIEQHQPKAKYAERLAVGQERLAELRTMRADAATEAETRRREARAREDARVEGLQKVLAHTETEHAAALRSLSERFARLTAEQEERLGGARVALVEYETQRNEHAAVIGRTAEASSRAATLAIDLEARRRDLEGVSTVLAVVQTNLAHLNEDRAAFTVKRATLEAARQESNRLTAEWQEWTRLHKAFHRDGLPVIEIDNAGPTISSTVNDLLRSCGLGRFSVEIITQDVKATKGKDGSMMKDVFELRVFDADMGGAQRDLGMLSGGQQVVVDEALKNGIALLVNQRNVFPIHTCWRDENTGSLDQETAIQYVAMLRRFFELGGYHHLIFITHNPDCAAIADAQVIVQDGGTLRVERPPYGGEPLAEVA